MKRIESKKSHSGWWDSHISRKNSKWLHENLQEMDHLVKRMLKLIDEDADSFARKAELYFKKRPDLLGLVEECYRMYRSLAERYDHVTGELRKNIHSDLQSQGSRVSDMGSEPPSTMASLDQRPGRTKSEPWAAGFDFFLGSSGSGSDLTSKEGDESSTLDSEWDSDDDSSVNNYSSTQSNGDEQGLCRRVLELEAELHEVKEKLRSQTEEISEGLKRDDRKSSEFQAKIASYEEELRVANENMEASREEMTCLRTELEKYKSWGDSNGVLSERVVKGFEILEWRTLPDQNRVGEVRQSDGSSETEVGFAHTVQSLERELRITKDKLRESEDEAARLRQEIASKGSSLQNLQDQLKSVQKEVSIWKNKLEREKREVSKLLDRIVRYKTNLSDRDQEIRGLKEAIGNANKSLAEENEKLQAEMTRITKERAYLEENLKELDLRCQSLEAEVRRVKAAKAKMEVLFGAEIEQLNNNLEELKVKYDMLMAVRDDLTVKMSSKDDQMAQMSQHLHRLHMQHVELIASTEEARKSAEELGLRVKELEMEVERKNETILDGAEEKREAIRQLCFSIEHYRSGYDQLRRAVIARKRPAVMAA